MSENKKVESSLRDLRALSVHDILIRPVITEKSLLQAGLNRYTFIVNPTANKTQIKQAVEQAFDVKVTAVNVSKLPGKKRRRGRTVGYTQTRKKAMVTLRAGDRIEIGGNPLFEV